MDRHLLRTFQQQIHAQCDYVLLSAQYLQAALDQRLSPLHVFYAVQNLLTAAANIAKALWGQGGQHAADRQPLRDSIRVADTSPLRVVTMRNNFEHFDERIDRWWNQSSAHNNVDFNVRPEDSIAGVDDIDMFRNFDPATGNLSFWGQPFNLIEIISEVQRIYPKVTEEANKPHWQE